MKRKGKIILLLLLSLGKTVVFSDAQSPASQEPAIRIMQLRREGDARIRYPDALPSLLAFMNEHARVTSVSYTHLTLPTNREV